MCNIILNQVLDKSKISQAKDIIISLQNELVEHIQNGSGPFLACICDEAGNCMVKASNSVEKENCSNNHAEMNAIKLAQQKFGTYNLSQYNLSIYVTSEPCMMCLGAIMWSGLKGVYYGVPSKIVEEITGFDEGFKPDWFNEFKKRNIVACGNIEISLGKQRLIEYVKAGKTIYKPN